ncbi:hypothetical protein STEG23_002643 [Scotinomys teguina]
MGEASEGEWRSFSEEASLPLTCGAGAGSQGSDEIGESGPGASGIIKPMLEKATDSKEQPHLHCCCGNNSMPEIKTGSS